MITKLNGADQAMAENEHARSHKRRAPMELAAEIEALLTEEQCAWLRRFGRWCRALRDGQIVAATEPHLHFVRVCFGITAARTWEEETWLAYQEAATDFPRVTVPERVAPEEQLRDEHSIILPLNTGADLDEVERTEQYIRAQSRWTGGFGSWAHTTSVAHRSQVGPDQEDVAHKPKK